MILPHQLVPCLPSGDTQRDNQDTETRPHSHICQLGSRKMGVYQHKQTSYCARFDLVHLDNSVFVRSSPEAICSVAVSLFVVVKSGLTSESAEALRPE